MTRAKSSPLKFDALAEVYAPMEETTSNSPIARSGSIWSRQTTSLESHVGFIEATLAAGRDPQKAYDGRYPPNSPIAHFVHAYLAMKQLAELDGAAFDRAWQTTEALLDEITAALPQKCEVEALHGQATGAQALD